MDSYFGNVNDTLLSLVRPSDSRILEFGCGSGAFAKAVLEKVAPAAHYVGIDVHQESVERARLITTSCFLRNIDSIECWQHDPELSQVAPLETFDTVVLGDVLEHLIDPLRCLSHARQLAHAGGQVLACIPNVQHWSVFVQLVLGSWPRADAGLFDRTHLRWFTLDDMVSLFAQAGLRVLAVIPRVFDPSRGQDIMEYLEPLGRHLGANTEQLIARGLPLQYVLQGTPLANNAHS
jgi:SAM-dependent methyltransferase